MTVNIIFNVLEAIAAIFIPVAAMHYIKNKFDGKLRNLFDGAAVFLIFYCVVYAVLSVCIEFMTPLYEKIESELWLIIFNVFFETLCIVIGYTIWFKWVIKKKDDNGAGLMTGAGFAFIRTIFSYGITAVLSVIMGSLYISGKADAVPQIFESNLDAFLSTTPFYSFLLLIQLISVFVIETAFAFIIYRTKNCDDKGYWSFIAFILRMVAIVLLKCGLFVDRIVIVFIVVAIAIVLSGIGYSLVKPFVRKPDEVNSEDK
jgi:uncharacterized membrane protein YhfC